MTAKEYYGDFRRRFILHTVVPVLGLPLCLPLVLRSLGLLSATWWEMILLELMSVILWNTARVQWDNLRQQREAKRLGGRMVPRYKGRWPGNLDLLIKLQKTEK